MRAVLGIGVMLAVAAGVLFGAAGTVHWLAGWAYLLLISAVTLASRLIVLWRNPDTLQERARFATVAGVVPGDRALVLVIAVLGPVALLLVSGLDHRFAWSPAAAPELQLAAACCLLAGGALAGWAMAVNPFFSAVARIQNDRGQVVVAAGPYRWIRHPGYARLLPGVW